MGPRLTRITLRGFKTIRSLTDFEPGNLTVLIGPNGAGKTNFISFFRMLSWAMAPPGQLQVYVAQNGNANAFLHDGALVTTQIEAVLTLRTDVAINDYGFRLSHAAGDTLLYTDEWFLYEQRGKFPLRRDLGAGHRESQLMAREGTAKVILGMLRRIIVHQFHNTSRTARIRNKWDVSDNRWLKEDGANLAPFLYRLEAQHPAFYNRIQDTLRLILPFLPPSNSIRSPATSSFAGAKSAPTRFSTHRKPRMACCGGRPPRRTTVHPLYPVA